LQHVQLPDPITVIDTFEVIGTAHTYAGEFIDVFGPVYEFEATVTGSVDDFAFFNLIWYVEDTENPGTFLRPLPGGRRPVAAERNYRDGYRVYLAPRPTSRSRRSIPRSTNLFWPWCCMTPS
jgi:hypothetical protein